MSRTPSPGGSRRYRRVAVTYTVAREHVPTSGPTLSSPQAAAELARELLAAHDDDREHFWVIFLNAQNGYTGHHLVSTGSLSASIVHPREVLGPALREGAAHVILVHNHPSSDPTPSKEDVQLTRQLVEGARLLGIRLHDHVVIGNGTGHWVSLAQRGLL
jgi:DNA repair protein RadC